MIKYRGNRKLYIDTYPSPCPPIYILGACGISNYFGLSWSAASRGGLCGINDLRFLAFTLLSILVYLREYPKYPASR